MKSRIREILTDELKDSEENRELWTEAIDRLRRENGDPKKLELYQQWLAKAVETSVQIREMLEADSHTALKEQKD